MMRLLPVLMLAAAGCGPGFECAEVVSGLYQVAWTTETPGCPDKPDTTTEIGFRFDGCVATVDGDWEWEVHQTAADGREMEGTAVHRESGCSYHVLFTAAE